MKEQLHYYLSGAGDKWDLLSLRQSICQTTKVTTPGKEQGWAVQQQMLLENLSPMHVLKLLFIF